MKKISKSIGLFVLVLSLMLSVAACSSEGSDDNSTDEAAVTVPEGDPIMVFEGYGSAAFGPMESTISLYEGGDLIFSTMYANRETVFDGTWSMSEDEEVITINVNEREETTTWEAIKGDDGFYIFDYTTFDGKGDAVVAFTTDVK